eukprot:Partr_v1_DN26281_c0_g1_i11_m48152 putative histidine triad nucleotide binding protein
MSFHLNSKFGKRNVGLHILSHRQGRDSLQQGSALLLLAAAIITGWTKVYETAHVLAFMDVNPIAKKHVLIIPKTHSQFLHQVADEEMADLGVALKRVAKAIDA